MEKIDFLSVSVAALVYMLLFSFWQKLFNKKKKQKFLSYLISFIAIFMISYFFALMEILIGVTHFFDGLFLGALVFLGVIFPIQLFSFVWDQKKIKELFLDSSIYLLGCLIIGGILAG